jgi:putative polyhydroxyalkanoate system protein
MATIHLKHHHTLTPQETRARVDLIARHLKKKYQGAYSWEGNSLIFRRSGASGAVHLREGYVELRIKLGIIFAPMKAKIEGLIRQHIPEAMGERAG